MPVPSARRTCHRGRQITPCYDVMLAFANAQTITAPQFANNVNLTVDLGSSFAAGPGGTPGSGVGRIGGIWVTQIPAMDFASADEVYRLHLVGSNDPALGSGNVDLLLSTTSPPSLRG